MEGTVKFYNVVKRFGFISGDDGKDYFVHLSGLKPGTKLQEGDKVRFDSEDGEKGLKAVNVEKI
ncbi:cold shock domain-containing protein [Candidatus Micrarchaeota archaeon]|jgi:CspA family cold shock protein|nr:cold shock domain-containing protein [Candidatus Micrarchaeota archaeon]